MKRLALLLLILSGCNVAAQTPSPDVTDVIVLTGTAMPFQLTNTATIHATLTDTPLPGGFRLRGYQPPIYEVANVLEVVCHDKYFYWQVETYGMTWYEDAQAEKLCIMAGKL